MKKEDEKIEDLIDREALLDAMPKNDELLSFDVRRIIIAQTTVDANTVRHGRWESDMYFDEPVTRCTACKRGFAVGHKAERFRFCPNCRAKMYAKEEQQ